MCAEPSVDAWPVADAVEFVVYTRVEWAPSHASRARLAATKRHRWRGRMPDVGNLAPRSWPVAPLPPGLRAGHGGKQFRAHPAGSPPPGALIVMDLPPGAGPGHLAPGNGRAAT